jgi:hypothetical protein
MASEGEMEMRSLESGQQEFAPSNEQNIAYSKIKFRSENSKKKGEKVEKSVRREENQIDYTDISFGTVYI